MNFVNTLQKLEKIYGSDDDNENVFRIRIVHVIETVKTSSKDDFKKKLQEVWADKYNNGNISPTYNPLYTLMNHKNEKLSDCSGFIVCEIVKEYKSDDAVRLINDFSVDFRRMSDEKKDLLWYIPQPFEPDFNKSYNASTKKKKRSKSSKK